MLAAPLNKNIKEKITVTPVETIAVTLMSIGIPLMPPGESANNADFEVTSRHQTPTPMVINPIVQEAIFCFIVLVLLISLGG